MLTLPNLSLYIHIPWCVQKCPYCDFNSHTLKGDLPHLDYVRHLLLDLDEELQQVPNLRARQLHSIFIGGGTPSLLTEEAVQILLSEIKSRIACTNDIEITLEANPGTVESHRFLAYQQAGITRISMGVQSFQDHHLQKLGRIHSVQETKAALSLIKQIPLDSFNLDLIHGLPQQTVKEALDDIRQAISAAPHHLSWYQLTIEPNTLFASRPPALPHEDLLWSIYSKGHQILTEAGYQQYEISAYAKPGHQSQHNLNYWRFGDYIGIGCGAHGKISYEDGRIVRSQKVRHPQGYLRGNYLNERHDVPMAERPFEFFMNRFRLYEPIPKEDFILLTGAQLTQIENKISSALEKNYLIEQTTTWETTEKGKLYLNDLLDLFLN